MPGVSDNARHIKLFTAVFISAVLSAVFFLPLLKGITITDYKTGELLYFHTADAGEIFSVHYIHSVNKSPVEDFFLINNSSELILTKTVFKSFGAGVPSSPCDGGEMKVYNDRIEVADINRRIERFLLFIGVTADHRFKIADEDLLLRDISPPQSSLLIRVERISFFSFSGLRYFK